jgi:hypothetical protein
MASQIRISENLDAELAAARDKHKSETAQLKQQLLSLQGQLNDSQAQVAVAAQSILEASTLREEVKLEKARAENAMRQAELLLKSSQSSSAGLESQLIDAFTKLQLKDQEISHLQATVHQECEERTYILEQLNALRRENSLPALAPADLRKLATEYISKHPELAGAGSSGGTKFPPIGRPPSSGGASAGRRSSVGSSRDPSSEGDDGGEEAQMWMNAGRGRGAARGKPRGLAAKTRSFHG